MFCCLFFFNDTATTEIYTLSLHDALPISVATSLKVLADADDCTRWCKIQTSRYSPRGDKWSLARVPLCLKRSEEHTSELQSRQYLVCRLLLEKKKNSR